MDKNLRSNLMELSDTLHVDSGEVSRAVWLVISPAFVDSLPNADAKVKYAEGISTAYEGHVRNAFEDLILDDEVTTTEDLLRRLRIEIERIGSEEELGTEYVARGNPILFGQVEASTNFGANFVAALEARITKLTAVDVEKMTPPEAPSWPQGSKELCKVVRNLEVIDEMDYIHQIKELFGLQEGNRFDARLMARNFSEVMKDFSIRFGKGFGPAGTLASDDKLPDYFGTIVRGMREFVEENPNHIRPIGAAGIGVFFG